MARGQCHIRGPKFCCVSILASILGRANQRGSKPKGAITHFIFDHKNQPGREGGGSNDPSSKSGRADSDLRDGRRIRRQHGAPQGHHR